MTRYAFIKGTRNYLHCTKIRKYYKSVEDYTFPSPILKEDGTLGSSLFAVSASQMWSMYGYRVFDGTNSAWHTAQKTTSAKVPFIFYSKRPIKVNSITFTNRIGDPNAVYPASSVILYGSNSNGSYTQLASKSNSVTSEGGQWTLTANSSVAYTYHKLEFTVPYQYFALSEMVLNATLATPITSLVETDISDYDSYVDILVPYGIEK